MNKENVRGIFPESIKRNLRILRSLVGMVYYRFPARSLKLIGVTGTSGKSTTANMIYHILEQSGFSVGVISTINAKAGRKSLDTGFHVTTPEPIQFQKLLRFMAKRKVEYVVVEASSHALAQGRLGITKFEYSVFTNIKRDHLDWHKTWENYAASKAILANKTRKKILVNRDDKDMYNFLSNFLGERTERDVITYSMKEPTNTEETAVGTKFVLNGVEYQLPVLGIYNVENALAAINICKLLGLSDITIAASLKSFIGLEGRMQVMQARPFLVIVDFAHNTDSLIKSLLTAQKLKSIGGKVIVVFGSAGLRDKEKRFTMGEAAAQYADVVVITAEDPRTESLFDINNEIIQGAVKGGGKLEKRFANSSEFNIFDAEHLVLEKGMIFAFDEENVNSRYDAIEFAVRAAKEGDVVITEGKGHEKSLCFGTTEYDFTDQKAVERAIHGENINFSD